MNDFSAIKRNILFDLSRCLIMLVGSKDGASQAVVCSGDVPARLTYVGTMAATRSDVGLLCLSWFRFEGDYGYKLKKFGFVLSDSPLVQENQSAKTEVY